MTNYIADQGDGRFPNAPKYTPKIPCPVQYQEVTYTYSKGSLTSCLLVTKDTHKAIVIEFEYNNGNIYQAAICKEKYGEKFDVINSGTTGWTAVSNIGYVVVKHTYGYRPSVSDLKEGRFDFTYNGYDVSFNEAAEINCIDELTEYISEN